MSDKTGGTAQVKEITVDVEADGQVRIEAIGFSGTGCEQTTAFLEEALGTVMDRQRKPEYYQTNAIGRQQRLDGR